MGSRPRRRCSFQGTSWPLSGSVCTGWEPASTTSETLASSTPPCSVSPTPRRLPTTYSQRSTVVPVSTFTRALARFTFIHSHYEPEQYARVAQFVKWLLTRLCADMEQNGIVGLLQPDSEPFFFLSDMNKFMSYCFKFVVLRKPLWGVEH